MSELNFDVLEKNIRMLLENRNITQQQLAEIAGMTQANVSKSLNPNEKKHFTLDQVYRIAQHFGVSIDRLVGNTSSQSAGVSPKDALRFIVKYLCAGDLRTDTLVVKEIKYEPDYEHGAYGECDRKEIEDTYPVFYFPDYRSFSDYYFSCDDEAMDLDHYFCSCGNDTKYFKLNEILKQLIPMVPLYRKGDIPEEAFQMIVDGYLKQLQE